MSSLTATFDECRKQPDGETLEQMRANYFTDIVMNERDCTSAGGLNIPQAGIINGVKEKKERKKHAKDVAFALKLLNDRLVALEAELAWIEDKLIRNNGVYFADDLAAEYLDAETNRTLMLIQDDEERRHAVAKELNKGIENGTLKSEKIYENTDIEKWLTVSKDYEETKLEVSQTVHDKNAQQLVSGEPITQNTKINHDISDGNEESVFDDIFTNKGPVTI